MPPVAGWPRLASYSNGAADGARGLRVGRRCGGGAGPRDKGRGCAGEVPPLRGAERAQREELGACRYVTRQGRRRRRDHRDRGDRRDRAMWQSLAKVVAAMHVLKLANGDEDITTINSDREDYSCDKVYLGQSVGRADVPVQRRRQSARSAWTSLQMCAVTTRRHAKIFK